MSTKKEIVIEGEKWILDLETGTVYRNVTMIPDGTESLSMSGRLGNYPIYEFRGVIYFETEKKNYKIKGEEAVELSKEEYDEVREYRTINKNDPATLQSISRYVVSVLIDDIMAVRYNIKTSFPVEPLHFVTRFQKKFTPEIKGQFDRLTNAIVAELPSQIKRKAMKQQVNAIYTQISQEDEDFVKDLIDKIYLNDKDTFDYIYESILNSRSSSQNQTEDTSRSRVTVDGTNVENAARIYEKNMYKAGAHMEYAMNNKPGLTNVPPRHENERRKTR